MSPDPNGTAAGLPLAHGAGQTGQESQRPAPHLVLGVVRPAERAERAERPRCVVGGGTPQFVISEIRLFVLVLGSPQQTLLSQKNIAGTKSSAGALHITPPL